MAASYRLMGVLNVTPDSFSDGGRFLDADAAIARARELVAQGAEILDVGGESTRPGAEPVPAEEELRRVLPVLEGIAAADLALVDGARAQVSIDTSKAAVARAAIAAGASIVNDVTALRGDPEMVGLVADSGVQCCLMHMLGEPRTMQSGADGVGGVGGPRYKDVVDEVRAFLEERLDFAVRAGVREELVLLDPGIGFGKTVAHNLSLLHHLPELVAAAAGTGCAGVMVGTSRKRFLGLLAAPAGSDQPAGVDERVEGSLATAAQAMVAGASVVRVHDVAATVQAARLYGPAA